MQGPLTGYKKATKTPIVPTAVLFAPSGLKYRIRWKMGLSQLPASKADHRSGATTTKRKNSLQ